MNMRIEPEQCSWLGRACLVFLCKDFVVWRLQIQGGYARASLLALRKNPHRNHFPPNCIVPAEIPRVSRPCAAKRGDEDTALCHCRI